jgi:hypothetical protein
MARCARRTKRHGQEFSWGFRVLADPSTVVFAFEFYSEGPAHSRQCTDEAVRGACRAD